jgi:23S rRNA (pseudouridine1915-N3)-methyltransferase
LRLHVAAIGKLKAGPESELAADYDKRISGLIKRAGITSFTMHESRESTKATASLRMAEEGEILKGFVAKSCFAMVLDERGSGLTSPGFAKLLEKQSSGGTGDLALFIGGPDGLSEDMRQSADAVLAFGTMTWPHRLVRVMILEQIYRALTIMLHHPYHRV